MTSVEIQRAEKRARTLYPRAKHFQGSYMKGVRACLSGRPIDSCPYRRDPHKTWRLAWRLAWISGYESVNHQGGEDR